MTDLFSVNAVKDTRQNRNERISWKNEITAAVTCQDFVDVNICKRYFDYIYPAKVCDDTAVSLDYS